KTGIRLSYQPLRAEARTNCYRHLDSHFLTFPQLPKLIPLVLIARETKGETRPQETPVFTINPPSISYTCLSSVHCERRARPEPVRAFFQTPHHAANTLGRSQALRRSCLHLRTATRAECGRRQSPASLQSCPIDLKRREGWS